MTSTDRSLVVAVRDGNEQAASILYDRYARRVFGLVRSKIGTKIGVVTEPEDIVQSVFKSVFRGMQSGNYDAPPGSTLWNLLAVIAVRKLTNQANHHTRQRRDISRNVSLEAASDGIKDSIDQTSMEFLEICIRESLESLRPIDREILTLRIAGHSIEEIHQKTNRSRRTIERSLQRSREQLAEQLLSE
ncbi:RNA polymerase sigma factor [Rhodopirellula sp. MGV]|uniref:RNA polymerase sigma factor n=1 Tax=Rhodopirellula sp. MGV TaxID=2023130 RepID=UPI000B967E37|nr:sigma-70 family RNA polymerase sigma factor [Rhodopirellula sp. MGV]OYP28317.1 hypothetical protein CGZ80_26220 [Rhodopirellula sp. MGV]PNY38805.1 sigma-70 family RNA polymerase sigma factor [Rhodopirellula baltica]